MRGTMDVAGVLEELGARAALPPEAARTLPPAVYTSTAFHELELAHIFAREWHCVGRADELAEPGAYRTLAIAHEPVILLRGADGALRALSNVCRHRMSALLRGEGRVERRIVCPYHAWSYDLAGALVGAPHMGEEFRPEGTRLPALGLEVWEGFVYVNLDAAAPPLGPRLAGLSERYASYRMADYRSLFRVDEVWDSNWKILVENFVDPYHLFRVHKETVEPVLPTRLAEPLPGGEGYNLFEQGRIPGRAFEYGAPMDAVNPALTKRERMTVPIFCVYPAHTVSLSPERLFWLALQPDGTERVRVRWGVDVHPASFPDGEDGEARKRELRASFDRINDEDKPIVAAVRRNAAARFAASGPLAPKERTLWEFQRYLARRLCAPPDAP